MSKQYRKIIEIDEERCTGCGQCIVDCAEGALAIVDGKARIVKDSFCDGLGACIGACPENALRIIERDADAFNEAAAMDWVATRDSGQSKTEEKPVTAKSAAGTGVPVHASGSATHQARPHGGGCPGSMARRLTPPASLPFAVATPDGPVSGPGHWPLKIRLVPPTAEYLRDADVLVAADCAAAASPLFHSEFARGKVVLIGCPKFDDTEAYAQKLADILTTSGVRSISVLRMEVPCCRGLSQAVVEAVRRSESPLEPEEIIMTCGGTRAQKTLFGQ